jgi:WD40 repeat protein
MPDRLPEYDLLLSYAEKDKDWVEEALARRLRDEGIRVCLPPQHSAPDQHWDDWSQREGTKYRKLIAVFSPNYGADAQVIARISSFYQTNVNRLTTERPVIPVLLDGERLPVGWEQLLPLDFSNPEDFELRLRQLVEALDRPGWFPPEANADHPRPSTVLRTLAQWLGRKVSDGNFEDAVEEVYRLLGFGVRRNETIDGISIPFLTERKGGGIVTRTVIECSEQPLAGNHLDGLLERRALIRERLPELRFLLVNSHVLDLPSRKKLTEAKVEHIPFPELLREVVPLDQYVDGLIAGEEKWRADSWRGEDWFIRPDVRVEELPDRHPAMIAIHDWLAGKRGNLLALLGDLGTGKTTLARFLAHQMALAYKQDPLRHPAPVLIDLKDVSKETSLEGIVISHFSGKLTREAMNEFRYKGFEHLLRHGRIVLLFDAFDEMAEHVSSIVMEKNLRELIKPIKQGGKILLTCRTHYFKNLLEEEKFLGKGAVYLEEFTDEQVQRYLAKARPATAKDDWEIIQGVYNLKELALRPLLLEMVVKSMPDLPRVNSATLYTRYAEEWVVREQQKKRPLDPQVKLGLMKDLAWQIWDDEAHAIQPDYLARLVESLRRSHNLNFHGQEDMEVAEELRTASFLKRDDKGTYTFADPSFSEYFLACKLRDGLTQPDQSTAIGDLLRTRLFNPKVVFFLSQMITDDALFQPLRKILTQGYSSLVSENALQILYWNTRIQMGMEEKVYDPDSLRRLFGGRLPRGAQLCNAKLKGVTLEAADLSEADFSGADLTQVNFTRADLQNVSFRGAILMNATLEHASAISANFREAELSGAVIRHNDLQNADFTGSIHREIVFEKNEIAAARGLNDRGEPIREDLIPAVQTFSAGLHSIAIGPGGEWYASGHQDGLITVHRSLDDRFLYTLEGHKRLPDSLQFSPSGALLVSGGRDKTIRLWSVSDGETLQKIESHGDWIRTVCFSPDGKLAASGGDDGVVWLWQVDEGKALRQFSGFEGHKSRVNAVHFSPDGKFLASAGNDGTARIWEVGAAKVRHALRVEDDSFAPRKVSVTAVQFSPDGKLLAAAGADFHIRLWSAADGQSIHLLKAHTHEVSALCFSTDGKWLFSGGKDRRLLVWSIANGTLHLVSEEHSDFIDTAWISAGDRQVMSGSTDRTIRRWSFTGDRLLAAPAAQADPPLRRAALRSVSLSPDGRLAATGGDDNRVYVWPASESKLLFALDGHKTPIRSVEFSPDGQRLASGSEDGMIRIWSAVDGQLLRTIKAHPEKMTAIRFSPNGTSLVSASENRSLKLWLAENGEPLNSIRLPQTGINAICFSPDEKLLAAGCEDKSILLWPQTLHQSRKLEGHAAGVTAVQFSPDGAWLASGGKDSSVRLWRLAVGQQRFALEGHKERISALQFSPTGSFLASASLDGTVRIWNVETGKSARILTGHLGEVYSVAFTGDGKCLIAAGAAGRLQYWDLETGQPCLYRYALGPGAWLDLLPDGRFNASAEGRRYLCYTEKGTLHSHPAETMMSAFYQPEAIEAVLKGLVGAAVE